MRACVAAAIAFTLLLVPTARAQDPGRIFGIIMGEVERQIDRQQRRQWEREQRRQHEAQWESFRALWRACFDQSDLSSCDQALAFPNIGADNQRRLTEQLNALMAGEQSAREEARRQAAEAEAAAEARRLERERQLAARRAEEERITKHRAYLEALADCRRFRPDACDRALEFGLATADDRTRVVGWRQVAERFAFEWDACRSGSIEACDRAAGSPAANAEHRRQIAEWRLAASPWNRFKAAIAKAAANARDVIVAIPAAIVALPRSTLISGSIAAVLALALGLMAWRQRVQQAVSSPSPSRSSLSGLLQSITDGLKHAVAWLRTLTLPARLRRLARRVYVRLLFRMQRHRAADTRPAASQPAHAPPAPHQPRDPETAVGALQLARAYLAEFDGKHGSIVDDPIAGKRGLNTLSLVSQQLVIAERADPSATLEVELDNGASVSFTLAELKAEALYIEAICRSGEKPRRAIAILEQAAALDPSHTGIPFLAGLLHMDLMHKRAAVAAFERALALDPDNLEFRKMLVRAQGLSGVEVAYHKAATGVRRGIATARVISLLVQLSPLIFLVISMLTFLFASTPEGRASAFTPFLISMLLALLFGAIRMAKHRVTHWFREHSV